MELKLEWYNEHFSKELFDAIDRSAHPHGPTKQIRPIEIAAAVLRNAVKTIEDYQSLYVEILYKNMKAKD